MSSSLALTGDGPNFRGARVVARNIPHAVRPYRMNGSGRTPTTDTRQQPTGTAAPRRFSLSRASACGQQPAAEPQPPAAEWSPAQARPRQCRRRRFPRRLAKVGERRRASPCFQMRSHIRRASPESTPPHSRQPRLNRPATRPQAMRQSPRRCPKPTARPRRSSPNRCRTKRSARRSPTFRR